MSSHKDTRVPLSALRLNPENPRHEPSAPQRSIINLMLSEFGEKIYNLACDIAKYGLNPTDRILVTNAGDNAYTVLEGNRRITALKVLSDPELCEDEKYKKKFKGIAIDVPIENEITVVEIFDENIANHFVALRHTGENNGIGIVAWGAEEKARFESRIKGKPSYPYALDVLDFMKKHIIDEKVFNNFPISTLHRVLTDAEAQEFLGLKVIDGNICTTLEMQEILKGLKRLISDLGLEKITVEDVRYPVNRAAYFKKFDQDEIPDKTKLIESPVQLSFMSAGTKSKDKPSVSTRIYTPRVSLKLFSKRTLPCNTESAKVRELYNELSDLNIRQHKNACILLIRCFLEVSIKDFLKRKNHWGKLNKVKSGDIPELSQMIDYLIQKQCSLIEDPEVKDILRKVHKDQHIGALSDLNKFTHSETLSPYENEIRNCWNRYYRLFKILIG